MQAIYITLCILGTALPLSQFAPWLADYGVNMPLLMQQIAADRLSAFAWLDVLVSAGVLMVFVLTESHRLRMRHGPWALLGLGVGVSLALPLFLLLRERHVQRLDAQERP
ncbi:MAG: DUF2834 domain-containing protein [Pseudomonadota bacterium]|nr:DUF2834 domain-containing protein [Pseudomonadota bacterium]